jgi:putative ABC transport system permease protein
LMLGIGANTAIFSVINTVMVRPLPYPEPDRLMTVMRVGADGTSQQQPTGLTFQFLRERYTAFEHIAARRFSVSGTAVATETHAEPVASASVSADYFRVLGLEPILGRSFTADEDSAGGPPVVIISHALWQRLFRGDPSIAGRTVHLGGRPHTIVGVTPAALTTFPTADVWTPLRVEPGTTDLETIGRLRRGVTLMAARAEMDALGVRLRELLPGGANPGDSASTARALGAFGMVPLQDALVEWVRPALLILSGAAGLVLLIACANIASLLLARATGRRKEIATRAALGATRGRIVRQLLIESVLLAGIGGALGVLAAYLSLHALLSLVPPDVTSLWRDIAIDRTVLAAAFAATILTGVIFGLAPAFDMARVDVRGVMLEGDGRATASGRVAWMRHGLVIAQVALCVTLLIGAGLLVRTFINLVNVPTGIETRRVITAQMSLRDVKDPARVLSLYERTLTDLRALPGVEAAAVMSDLPLTRGLRLGMRLADGPAAETGAAAGPAAGAAADRINVDWRYVTPEFLTVFRVPVIVGRAITERDTASTAPVALVNEAFARRYISVNAPLTNRDAIGRRIEMLSARKVTMTMEIVGVIGDVRSSLSAPVRPTVYVPVWQVPEPTFTVAHGYFPVSWVVRTRDDRGAAVAQSLREIVRRVEPQLPLASVQTMEDVVASGLRTSRSQMLLLGIFAGIALALAAAGLYGLVAYTVAQRTREIGIHMALGATAGVILRRIVARGLLLTLAGLVAGLGAATITSRWLESFLVGVKALDPLTFVLTSLFLIATATIASLAPAVRAARINPMAILRNE